MPGTVITTTKGEAPVLGTNMISEPSPPAVMSTEIRALRLSAQGAAQPPQPAARVLSQQKEHFQLDEAGKGGSWGAPGRAQQPIP